MTHTVSSTHDTLAHVLDAQGRRVSRHDVISNAYAEAERLNGEGMSKIETETEIEDGGPAFPVDTYLRQNIAAHGMSLRDWFAGQAMAEFLASRGGAGSGDPLRVVALAAYKVADAMLAARKP